MCLHNDQNFHLSVSHMSKPSSIIPLMLALPTRANVGSQSETCISSRLTALSIGNTGPVMNARPLTPPSQVVPFPPLKGQLLPPKTGFPPLSAMHIDHSSF